MRGRAQSLLTDALGPFSAVGTYCKHDRARVEGALGTATRLCLFPEGRVQVKSAAKADRERTSVGGDISFRFFPAEPPLDSFVEYFYLSCLSSSFMGLARGVRLPELEAQLVFAIEEGQSFPGGIWISSTLRACLFLQPAHLSVIPIPSTIRAAVGVSLRPPALRILFQHLPADLGNATLIALQDIWGARAGVLLDRLVEQQTPLARVQVLRAYLRSRLPSLGTPHFGVTRAVDLLKSARGGISTESLAGTLGCTSRTLHRSMVNEVGLAPKHVARILRVRHALSLLNTPYAQARDVAAASAYSDQAHMTREFRTLLGHTPIGLLREIRTTTTPKYSSERELSGTGLLVLLAG